MTIKKNGNFRASKRGMSTLAVPSRQGLLKLDNLQAFQVEDWSDWDPIIDSSGAGNATLNNVSHARYRRIGASLEIDARITIGFGGAAGSVIYLSGMPYNPSLGTNQGTAVSIISSTAGINNTGHATIESSNNRIAIRKDDVSNFPTSGSSVFYVKLIYEIDESEAYKPTQTIEEIIEKSFFDLNVQPEHTYGFKFLQSSTSSTGILSDLTFSNLEVGKTYRITLNGEVDTAAGFTTLYLIENGNDIARVGIDGDDGGTVNEETGIGLTKTIIHTMQTNTLEVELRSVGTGGNVFGDGTSERTSLLVEEIPKPNNSLS